MWWWSLFKAKWPTCAIKYCGKPCSWMHHINMIICLLYYILYIWIQTLVYPVYSLWLSLYELMAVFLSVVFCPSPCLALLLLWDHSMFCSQGYDLEIKWPQPFCQERLCTSATTEREMETGLQASFFCFTSLILACALFFSSWDRHYDCSENHCSHQCCLGNCQAYRAHMTQGHLAPWIASSLVFPFEDVSNCNMHFYMLVYVGESGWNKSHLVS